MAYLKVLMVCLLAAAATGEPPVPGYNYQQPIHNNYQAPTNSYLPPTGFSAPSNTYLPPASGHQNSFNHGLQNHGQYSNEGQYSNQGQYANHGQHGNFGQNGNYGQHGNHGQDHHAHGHGHDNEVPKSYEFGYSVKDAQSGNDYDRKESSDGNVVRGEYRVQLPDGRTQIVTYHADWQSGFHADVRYEGEAKYPEPTYNNRQQGGYNYNTPQDFSGSLTGFNNNNNYKQPSTAYGPPGYH